MSSDSDQAFDAPALRPQDWRRPAAAATRPPPRLSRGESAASQLIALAEAAVPGDRLGSKEELRARCEVSVGTFNEAVRIAQSRGVVSVRPGPGGGVFVAEQSPLVRLGNSVLALDGDHTSVAEAVRIRDALDALLIEDALWHASPADIAEMREILAIMAAAAGRQDGIGFVRANWDLHAMLRSLYITLLGHIESHTLAVLPLREQPLPQTLTERHLLHVNLVDALDARDRARALDLIAHHNTDNELTVAAGAPASSSAPRG